MWDEVLLFLVPFQNFSRVHCTQVSDSGPLGLLFLGSLGMNRSAGQTNCVNRFSGDLFVPRNDSFPMIPGKRHSFLIFTMLPTRTLSKILREKLSIQKSHSNLLNRHLTSFDVLITAHVIRPNCQTFFLLSSSEIELKNFSRVQRRKYDTIVNIYSLLSVRDITHFSSK